MMKKNISYIPMDHTLEIWLLEKLLREPPESAYTKDLLSGIQDMISGEVSSLLLGDSEDTEVAIGIQSDALLIGDLEIRPRSRKVLIKGSEISLTPKEFDILYFLAKNRAEVFTKEQIYQHIYEDVESEVDNRVYGLVKNLRKKIEENPEEPHYIETIRGVGYRFRA